MIDRFSPDINEDSSQHTFINAQYTKYLHISRAPTQMIRRNVSVHKIIVSVAQWHPIEVQKKTIA